jgi:Zn-dependent peptidase ImmA (M78 family)
MTRKEAAQAATELLGQHPVVEPPVPVEQIAIAHGIQVARSAAAWSESGFLLRDGDRTIIGINSRNSPRRQRFSIAHELGHWMLHDGKPLIVDQSVLINKRDEISSQASDLEEIQANQFAAALLMPEDFVRRALKETMSQSIGSREELITVMAREFDVSTEAMGWRLINLGLLLA